MPEQSPAHDDNATADDWSQRFNTFVEQNPDLVRWLESDHSATENFDGYVEEARYAASLIGPHISASDTVLEIGAGIGLLSAFLSDHVAGVVALEPGEQGFIERRDLDRTHPAMRRVTWSALPAEDFDGGPFDLIFSVNVVEHISALDDAVRNLARLLAPTGKMVHACPNYTVPFEPHFGLPLLPLRPALTTHLLPDNVTQSGLWQSLNFVTANQLSALGDANGLQVEFEPAVFATAVQRLGDDQEFARRHPLLRPLAGLARSQRLVSILRAIPPRWATPMVAVMRHRDDPTDTVRD